MDWQEYESAVAGLYARLAQQGTLIRNHHRPDRQTNSPRQIDLWWEIDLAGHLLYVLIDAKHRRTKVDIKDVEEVLSLADAVGAHKAVLVAPHGWTAPAERKARTSGMDLRLFSLDDALRILDVHYWLMCPACAQDCVILDQAGLSVAFNEETVWCVGGRCRECGAAAAECGRCGERVILRPGESADCRCGHGWSNSAGRVFFRYGPAPGVALALDKLHS